MRLPWRIRTCLREEQNDGANFGERRVEKPSQGVPLKKRLVPRSCSRSRWAKSKIVPSG